jgi:hypothetical protein
MIRPAVLFVIEIVVLGFSGQAVEAAAPCSGSSANLNCLAQNFDEFYEKDYGLFWTILNKSAEEAKQCRSIKKIAEFLRLVRIKSNNAEFNEFFAQVTENLCVTSPRCFKRASKLLDKEDQKNLADMLNAPIFVDRERFPEAGCLGN